MFRSLTVTVCLSPFFLFASNANATVLWDGNVVPTAVSGYAAVFTAPAGFTFNSPTGFTTQIRASNTNGSAYGLTTAAAAAELNATNGWSVEVRVQSNLNTAANLFVYNVGFHTWDNFGKLSLSLQPTQVVTNPELANASTVTTPLASGFHTYKIVRLAGNTTSFLVQIDGGTPFSVVSAAPNTTPVFQFGDITSSMGSSNSVWDYIYINSTVADIDAGSASFANRIVGSGASQAVSLYGMAQAAAAYTSSTTGDAQITAGGSGNISTYGTGSTTVGFDTTTAGAKSGIVTIDDGNADVDEIIVTGSVFDASKARFNSNLGGTLTINFGPLMQGSGVQSLGDAIRNVLQTSGFTAELDFDSILGAGDTGVLFTDLADNEFANLTADTFYNFLASFDTNNALGSYTATYTIGLSDANGYIGAGAANSQSLTLTLKGSIVPEPSAWIIMMIGSVVVLAARRTRKIA